ncbi:MAG: hypothetical protein ACKV2T_00805 [Kofleriaceae bacterium]
MSWAAVVFDHARAIEFLDYFSTNAAPNSIDILTSAWVHAAAHGVPKHRLLVEKLLDKWTWRPMRASELRKVEAPANLIVAGASLAALRADRDAIAFLADVAKLSTNKRPDVRAAAAIASGLTEGAWHPAEDWSETPATLDAMYEGIVASSLEAGLNVVHTPGAFWYAHGIHFTLAMSLIGAIGKSLDAAFELSSKRLRPGDSRRGRTLYQRADIPPAQEQLAKQERRVGIGAIDLGDRMRVYLDAFTHVGSLWKFDPASDRAASILDLDEQAWTVVQKHVDAETWDAIEKHRETAVHVMVINPRRTSIPGGTLQLAAKRFGRDIEAVSVVET